MVFVHSRGDTFRTARALRTSAQQLNHMMYFRNNDSSTIKICLKKVIYDRYHVCQLYFHFSFFIH